MTRREAALLFGSALKSVAADTTPGSGERVRFHRLPKGGIQPQIALDGRGILHAVYYSGDARQGDLFYVRSNDFGQTFSSAIQVNSQSGSAVAAGTIRGAQLALGKADRVHVAWNGSMQAEPKGPLNPDSRKNGMPMLYSRLDDAGKGFEPQRNLMQGSFGLDGGGSVAADHVGNVYVAWHGIGESEGSGSGKEGEARRSVWLTKSENSGRTFSKETKAWTQATGACGCCGMKIYSAANGNVFGLYRSATQAVHRDIYLLTSIDHGKSFRGHLLHKWEINACPMSSMDFADNGHSVIAAWETGGQVYWTRLDSLNAARPIPAPGEAKGRKHPRVAINGVGEVLLVWTEGTGWQRGGSLACQLYDPAGHPISEPKQFSGVPAWSFAAPIVGPKNAFIILY